MSTILKGNHYQFTDNGLIHKDIPDLIPYEDIIEVLFAVQSGHLVIQFVKKNNGITSSPKMVKVFLNEKSDDAQIKALLLEKIPDVKVHTRRQTAVEACSSWISVGLSLLGLIAIIIAINMVGRARVPVVMFPIIYIGSYLGMTGLGIVAGVVALVCVIGAVVSISKKREVCVIKQGE